jgi:hypothetical protein
MPDECPATYTRVVPATSTAMTSSGPIGEATEPGYAVIFVGVIAPRALVTFHMPFCAAVPRLTATYRTLGSFGSSAIDRIG